MTFEALRSRRDYCLAALADPAICTNRRRILEAKLAEANRSLASRCSRCGRTLTADESQAAGIGPVCAHQAA